MRIGEQLKGQERISSLGQGNEQRTFLKGDF